MVFIGGAVYSSFLALRNAPVAPAGHGGELQAFLPILRGQPVLYAGQDRYAAYELLGADTHVPLVEFPDPAVAQNPEKPFDTGDAYSPIDFDSFSRGTLDSFPYVITGRAAWNSGAPHGFRRVAATPSYVLWKRTGEVPEDRHVLLEGTNAGAFAGCASPEIRILLSNRGRASLFPGVEIAPKDALERRQQAEERAAHRAGDLAAARPLAPLAAVLLALRADPLGSRLPPGPEGGARRPAPQHDQPRQRRPVLARRRLREPRRQGPLHGRRGRAQLPPAPQRLRRQSPTSATWSRSAPASVASCRCTRPATGWIDSYESSERPP